MRMFWPNYLQIEHFGRRNFRRIDQRRRSRRRRAFGRAGRRRTDDTRPLRRQSDVAVLPLVESGVDSMFEILGQRYVQFLLFLAEHRVVDCSIARHQLRFSSTANKTQIINFRTPKYQKRPLWTEAQQPSEREIPPPVVSGSRFRVGMRPSYDNNTSARTLDRLTQFSLRFVLVQLV